MQSVNFTARNFYFYKGVVFLGTEYRLHLSKNPSLCVRLLLSCKSLNQPFLSKFGALVTQLQRVPNDRKGKNISLMSLAIPEPTGSFMIISLCFVLLIFANVRYECTLSTMGIHLNKIKTFR